MATSRQLREQIAAGRWDAALAALYGGSEEVLARQRSRYGAALEQFELYYGPGRQVQVYSAPGRTELGGNHTDHQHGYGLAGAVTLDLVAVASRNEDGFIRVKSRGFNKLDVIDLTEEEPQQGRAPTRPASSGASRRASGQRAAMWAASMPTRPAMCCGARDCPAQQPLRWAWP